MGLDLTIMPLNGTNALVGTVPGYDRLSFHRNYKIFGQIADVKGESVVPDQGLEAIVHTFPLPPGVKVEIYGENRARKTRKNNYGEEMVYTTAGEMRKLILPEGVSPKNKAILAYIKALPRDTPIVLEWR